MPRSIPSTSDESSAQAPAARQLAFPGEAASPAAAADGAPPLRGHSVWAIDAYSLIFQVFHALPEMSSPQGEPVNAVYGFARDLLIILTQKEPDYLLCAFDLPGKTFRHDLFEAYKIQRTEMPDELVPQIPMIHRLLEAIGIPIVTMEGQEADDVLATIARLCEEQEGTAYLVTNDKDCRQLISDRVFLYNARKNQIYDREMLAAEWGIRPDQVVDFQALVGDSVDNVPGVPLIGPKLARELLNKYETLDNVLVHADEVSGAKRRQNLIEGREQALLSRSLVRLTADLPLEIDWQQARVDRLHPGRAVPLLGEFGFRGLKDQFEALGGGAASDDWKTDYRTIDTPEALAEFAQQLAGQERFSLDTETTDISPTQAELVGYAIGWKPGEAYYLPVRAPEGEKHLDPDAARNVLRPIIENPFIEKVGQNLKYDMIVLRSAGIQLKGVAFDTMVASYLLDAGARNHNLDELARRHLNYTTTKIDALIGSGKNQKRIDEVPVAQVTQYAAEDADVALRLEPILAAGLAASQLESLFHSLELPLIDVLAEMEFNGIKVDVERLGELSREFGARLETLRADIYDLAGHEFNIDSPKQLQTVLFDELGLPAGKRTKTGPSTDAEVLESLAAIHPLPARILEYRQYAKLKGTYVDALPAMVNPRTGRVHCSFHQTVAATGRLSSSDPNLQNIPIRTEPGRAIRSAFRPGEPGWALLAADYSQIELRILAHFSGDEVLCEAFARDDDVHALVASQVYGVPLDAVTPAMRRSAKAVNFGVIYGQSPFGLSRQLGITQDEAEEFIDAYFARYPGVVEFLAKILEDCRQNGYVSTIMGRRRAIRGVRPEISRSRNLAERTAINTVIQGSAADLIKKAMIAVHRRLRESQLSAKMLLQIHDELVFEVPSTEQPRLADLVTEEMSGVMKLRVPLRVDLKSGQTWAEVEAWG